MRELRYCGPDMGGNQRERQCIITSYSPILLSSTMRLGAIPELPNAIAKSLEEHGIKTDAIFLSMAPLDILRKLPLGSISLGEINRCKEIVARVSAAPGQSASSLLKSVPQKPSSMNVELPLSLEPVQSYFSPHTDKVVELSGDRNSRKSVRRAHKVSCAGVY